MDVATAVLGQAISVLSQVLATTAKLTHIGEVPALIGRVPAEALILGHCLAVAAFTKGAWPTKLLGYVQGFLMAFGGGILANAFLGRPNDNVFFSSNQYLLIWTAAYWLVNHNPVDLVQNGLNSTPVGIFARVR